MKMKIQTITPVHIGSGGDYGPPEFYIARVNERHVVMRANINQIFMMLSDELKDQFILELEDPKFKLQSFLMKVRKNYLKVVSVKSDYITPIWGVRFLKILWNM